ncbi:MAG: Na/Pi cotransporter family protein [Muribaculaceae bacterium]|nr:Na/Pi cotransporter family protein [Muribaculaceae bacterium]
MDYSLLDFLCLLGAVGLFLYGMKVMSEGLQKAAGDRLRNILSAMTRNRFAGLLTGCAITALIQSSSASTVMVVSFVNAGLMTLGQSMAVIFGANVGTTFTAWIIALFGFKVNISTFVLPIIGVAVVLLLLNKSKTKSIGEFLIGFSFLFMGLDLISSYVPDLQNNPEMFAYLKQYASLGIRSILIFVLVGIVLTMIIQSSAATFAITLIMCSKGWITFDLACALVLGSNIGTTITPILASLSGNVAAKRASMGHLLFNLLGTIWCVCVFIPFADFNAWLTEAIGQGDPNALYGYVTNLEATAPEIYNHLFDNSLPQGHDALRQIAAMQMSVSFGLSIFHTTFNIVNVVVMIWLTNVYVKIVEWIVPSKSRDDEEFTLKFISGGLMNAAELNIATAEKEISVYAERVNRMIRMAQTLIHTPEKSEEYNTLLSRVEKYEDISDRMELEIAHYLNRCAEGRLSNEGKLKIAAMLNIISEIESIADSCMGIGKIMNRKIQSGVQFTKEIYDNIDTMYVYIKDAMTLMMAQLTNMESVSGKSLIESYNKEREINNYRNSLRGSNVENINEKHYEYQAGIYYMDIIGDLEKTGDYIINVVDTLRDNFHKAPK